MEPTITTHVVKAGPGQEHRVRIAHEEQAAVQYEFFIPEAIWEHPSVHAFRQWLASLEPGATIFAGMVGMWDGRPEPTRIYRTILRSGLFDPAKTRATLYNEIGRIMAELSNSAHDAQESFMFTEVDIRVIMSGGITKIS
ncbi:MAG: hypothetical protein HZA50_00510 [Planctomycetes bacterium]|nr:hypothetical protein [Planctomycetota bacterium]